MQLQAHGSFGTNQFKNYPMTHSKKQTMQPAEIITEKSYSLSVRNAQKQSSIIDSSLCNVITTSSVNKIHWICPSDAMKKKKKLHPAYGKCFLLIYK